MYKVYKANEKGAKNALINVQNRDKLTEFYRLYERYEIVQDDHDWWQALCADIRLMDAKYSGEPVMRGILAGYLQGMEQKLIEMRGEKKGASA